jgi:hypothetical protein
LGCEPLSAAPPALSIFRRLTQPFRAGLCLAAGPPGLEHFHGRVAEPQVPPFRYAAA